MIEDAPIHWTSIPGLTPRQVQALEQGMALRAKDRPASVAALYKALFPEPGSVSAAAPAVPAVPAEAEPAPFTTVPLNRNSYPSYTLPLQQESAPPVPRSTVPKEPAAAKKPPSKWLVAGAAVLCLLALFGLSMLRKDDAVPTMQSPETQPLPAATETEAPEKDDTAPAVQSPETQPLPAATETEAPETTESTAPTVTQITDRSAPGWEDNIPMADPVDNGNREAAFASPVYGSKYQRNQICSITFLDSTEAAGANCWDISQAQNGSVIAWVEQVEPPKYWEGAEPVYDLYIAGNGGVNAAPVCEGLFSCYKYLRTIDFNDCFHTEGATSMKEMFYFCRDLQTFDLSCFDTSDVTDMQYMFYYCCSPCQVDLSSFDTSNVTNMDYMFAQFTSTHYAVEEPLTSLDLSHFDTANVTSMAYMFDFCSGLEELDVSTFDTSKVTDMHCMFAQCESLRSLDLSSFDTSKVTSMQMMFYQCKALETLDISNFNTASVGNVSRMFYGVDTNTQVKFDRAGFRLKNAYAKDFTVPACMGDPKAFFEN